jgi:hypothetical protein
MNRIPAFMYLILLAAACRPAASQSMLEITDVTILDSLPSGSGLARSGDTLYIVSDDAPSIYMLRLDDGDVSKFGTSQTADSLKYRIAKNVKSDPESALIGIMQGKEYLFAFGSGSRSPQRDGLLVVDLHHVRDQQRFVLTDFYRYLRQQTGLSAAEWNLEGAAVIGDSLVLLNRGTNTVMILSWNAFTSYVFDKGPLPKLRHYSLTLPQLGDNTPRISGACGLADGRVLFTASVEDTPNWYSDGPVIGSAIGVFDIVAGKLEWCAFLKDKKGAYLKEKIESVELISQDKDRLEIIAVSDNDDGSSKLFRILWTGSPR